MNSFLIEIFKKDIAINSKIENLDEKYKKIEEIDEMIEFIKFSNKRGIASLNNE